jgi:heat-inducible transcriptional repressor
MIRQPEFVMPRPGEPAQLSNERLRQMVDFLYQEVALQRFLSRLPVVSEVQVVIGSGQVGGLEDYSFVLGRYGPTGDSSGYLGVVGPTRLQYPRAVALVRYMTDLMTDLLQAF